ncbi:type I secretion system permease/ATPase [Sphingomonas spermidinifaciens]|uniref:Type I secretion system permease/ATPase n=1 Tax=Sphingomonas spermidinifaciens TaxID=1141889 RepID=A0A2A4B1F9_9SPHN|nr:type I secretion system permease/ATPase [Sphingomonas spermidinifaciens]PCD01629.1 type I secretion system permease/ATPase [Sphingomonas spermidinifaciens]
MKMLSAISADPAPSLDDWMVMLRSIARHYRLPLSEQNVRIAGRWRQGDDECTMVKALARASGLSVRFQPGGGVRLTRSRLPVILRLTSGELLLMTAIDAEGQAVCAPAGDSGLETRLPLAELVAEATLIVVARPARSAPDPRIDAYVRPYEEHWLRRILMRDAGAYGHVMIASLVSNCLALATVLFSMQVYDRVVPANSTATLYILFAGVLLAILFDFALQRLRSIIIDVVGKRADLRISDRVFGHALRVRAEARPRSTGTFIAQLRDLDQVRDLLTSTTVAAVADLPFFVLFLFILWSIGGALALVPLVAVVLLLVPGLLAQRRMRALATEAMRESSLRNALLVEAVQGIEDIKLLQAEDRLQQQWNHYNAVAGEAQLRLRSLTNSLIGWTRAVQNGVYATIILIGAPMVIAADLTTGALVAVSILGSRMMAPMSSVTQLLSRYQQARVAAKGLDELMALPVDQPDFENRIPLAAANGKFAVRRAVFTYGVDPATRPALTIDALDIAAGEKVAILGRNGAGKSTLLQALSGLMRPTAGELLLDDLAVHQIDPADVRRDIGLLTQSSRLFHGTLRENLTLGAPQASAEAIWDALTMVGAATFVRQLPDGLEHPVLEGGRGLSGGQVQSLLLARLMLRDPVVLLLDEPTAAMDETVERQFIQRFRTWAEHRTVVVATHRMRVLDLADRVVVVDGGRILLDQPKAQAIRTMQGARAQAMGAPVAAGGHSV